MKVIDRHYPRANLFTRGTLKKMIKAGAFLIDRNNSVSNLSLIHYDKFDKLGNIHLMSFDRYLLNEIDVDIENNVFGIINLKVHQQIFNSLREVQLKYQDELIEKTFQSNQLNLY